jgi:CheY-like chemotaxis protein
MTSLPVEIHRLVRTAGVLEAKVLIVDDQEANVLLLRRLLVGAGYTHIDSTQDPQAVFALHQANDYALILLDLKMPVMDGFQVMDKLLEVETDGVLPVLVVTSEPGHKLRALRAGARDFVSKPLDLAEVLLRAHNAIEVQLLYRENARLTAQVAAMLALAPRTGPAAAPT